MRVVALSDLHGHLPEDVPPCDLLLLAGDLVPLKNHNPAFQATRFDTHFRLWLGRQRARRVVGVAGNHDFVFERAPDLVPRDLPYLLAGQRRGVGGLEDLGHAVAAVVL